MEEKEFLECIDFFNDLSVDVKDITSHDDEINKNKVVIATYHYKDKFFVTNKLYYKEISDLDDVKDINKLHQYFGHEVYWLDIKRHNWPQGSGGSDYINHRIIDDMTDDDDFKKLLLCLANNDHEGYIQKITQEGKSQQYSYNLENNNHWHDLIRWIKETIK